VRKEIQDCIATADVPEVRRVGHRGGVMARQKTASGIEFRINYEAAMAKRAEVAAQLIAEKFGKKKKAEEVKQIIIHAMNLPIPKEA
jgi:hypothetical protein